MEGVMITLLGVLVASHGALWYQVGQISKKTMCPFDKCPTFERAKQEAAPTREPRCSQ
jgi:hypothetical protein